MVTIIDTKIMTYIFRSSLRAWTLEGNKLVTAPVNNKAAYLALKTLLA